VKIKDFQPKIFDFRAFSLFSFSGAYVVEFLSPSSSRARGGSVRGPGLLRLSAGLLAHTEGGGK